MAKSLQDQLKKSGLVSAHDTRTASADKRKKNRKQRAGHADEDAARKAELAKSNAEKVARDRELNAARDAQAEARAVEAQVVQLIKMNRIERDDYADVIHHYTDEGAVKSLYVTAPLHAALVAGQVAIVRDEGGPALIPASAAAKVADRAPERILVMNDRATPEQDDKDDPYAEFEVPDDLMW
jgi:uncharacterized protein YaiL (DUF2058 family)